MGRPIFTHKSEEFKMLSIAIFEDDLGRFKLKLQKRYRAKDGSFRDTQIIFPNEMREMIKLLQAAIDWIQVRDAKQLERFAKVNKKPDIDIDQLY